MSYDRWLFHERHDLCCLGENSVFSARTTRNTNTQCPKSRALFRYSTRAASNSLHERPCHSPLSFAPPQATSSAARSVTVGSAAHDAAARNARGKISLKGLTRLTTITVPLPPPLPSIKLHFRSQCSFDTFICCFPA